MRGKHINFSPARINSTIHLQTPPRCYVQEMRCVALSESVRERLLEKNLSPWVPMGNCSRKDVEIA